METNELLIQIAFWAYVLVDGIAVTLAAIPFIHMLQLESYQGPMYLKWVRKHLGQWAGPFLAGVAGFLLRIAGQFFPGGFGTLLWRGGDVIFTGMMLAFGIMALKNQKKAKKPLRYTARVKRLLVPVFLLALVGRWRGCCCRRPMCGSFLMAYSLGAAGGTMASGQSLCGFCPGCCCPLWYAWPMCSPGRWKSWSRAGIWGTPGNACLPIRR